MAELRVKLADPDFNKRQAMIAFDSAEAWRKKKVLEIYDNVTNQELDGAVRWISYAEPFAEERSCYHSLPSWKQNTSMASLYSSVQATWSSEFVWNDDCRKAFLTLHAFHTTGIEGNTLTLTETALFTNM
jgi:hypothetical protein